MVAAGISFHQTWRFFLLAALLFVLGWILEIMSKSNVTFWMKVRDYPDFAYDWFKSNDNWIVTNELFADANQLLEKKRWVGPFRLCVPKLNGKIVKIYGKADDYEKAQDEFLRSVQTVEN